MITIHHLPTLEGDTYVFDRVRQVSTCTATPRTDAIAVHSTDSGELFARSYRALSSVTFLVDRYHRPADSDEPPPIADTPEGLAELGWSFVITFDAHDCVVLGEDHMPIPLARLRDRSVTLAVRMVNLDPAIDDYFTIRDSVMADLLRKTKESLAEETD